MADLRLLIPDSQQPPASSWDGVWYCTIQNSPVSLTARLNVIIPDVDPALLWRVFSWEPHVRYDDILLEWRYIYPVAGNIGLIVFDNRQNIWLVQWRT